jgi:hypothetical protein
MSALRGTLGLILCLIIAWALTYFVGLGNTVADLQALIGSGADAILTTVSAICIAQLGAYNLIATGTYAIIAALIVGGFVGGLVTRSPLGGFGLSISYMIILFVIPFGLNMVSTMDPVVSFNSILALLGPDTVQQAISLIVAFVALLVPAAIGGAITKEKE